MYRTVVQYVQLRRAGSWGSSEARFRPFHWGQVSEGEGQQNRNANGTKDLSGLQEEEKEQK